MTTTTPKTCQEYYDWLRDGYITAGIAGIVACMKAEGYPTDNACAEALWHLLSSHTGIRSDQASQAYTEMGYIPFSGFPLLRRK